MRYRVMGLLAAGCLAACSSGYQSDQARLTTAKDVEETHPVRLVVDGLGPARVRATLGRSADTSFASLPDRGDLVAYDRTRKVRKEGAFTSYPVSLSEAHALDAIGEGRELVITAPDGHPIRLQYDSHVEHEDGNWTWHGRAPGDPEGVATATLTFGEKAVFGSVPDGDEWPLLLDVTSGKAWLVETDRRLAAAANKAAGPMSVDDAPLLRTTSGESIKSARPFAAAAPMATADGAIAAPIVDLLIGYTTGMATKLGGDSQVRTRLNYLVDRGNIVLRNSEITGRVRLVHAMPVDYTDDGASVAALQAMSGFTCREAGCSPTTIPAALQPLHSARDTYGADLVSLVRVFKSEENLTCGAAWLIGGGRVAITPEDAVAGMSVVADTSGSSRCPWENLIHEIAHNMGSAHDRATASGANKILEANEYGRYNYSFGWKDYNTHTVMAIGDRYSTGWPGFSSPRVHCDQYDDRQACGVEGASDNASSLSHTMPIIATFRTRIPARVARNDFNGDGRSDLFWHNPEVITNMRWWYMNGQASQARFYENGAVGVNARVRATGDFDGDGRVDMLWDDNPLGLILKQSCGSAFCGWWDGMTAWVWRPDLNWQVTGAGDADGDGRADLLWEYSGAYMVGNFQVWLMAGKVTRSKALYTVPADYHVATTGDFNGDRKLDIVWRTGTANAYRLWLSGVSGFTGQSLAGPGKGWQLVGAGDVDNNGKSDLVWRLPQHVTANFRYWLMDGATRVGQKSYTQAATYSVVAMGDYDGNGQLDVVWRAGQSTDLRMWRNVGGTLVAGTINAYGTHWSVIPGN